MDSHALSYLTMESESVKVGDSSHHKKSIKHKKEHKKKRHDHSDPDAKPDAKRDAEHKKKKKHHDKDRDDMGFSSLNPILHCYFYLYDNYLIHVNDLSCSQMT